MVNLGILNSDKIGRGVSEYDASRMMNERGDRELGDGLVN